MVTGVVDVKTAVEAMKLGADGLHPQALRSRRADRFPRQDPGERRMRRRARALMEENLEFMGVLSLFERASGLFSTLSVDPFGGALDRRALSRDPRSVGRAVGCRGSRLRAA